MTDREVYEHLYRRYEKKDTTAEIATWERQQAEREKAFEQKPLADRKAEFWAMCQDWNIPEADIAAQWEAYLRGEGG